MKVFIFKTFHTFNIGIDNMHQNMDRIRHCDVKLAGFFLSFNNRIAKLEKSSKSYK